MQVCFEHREEIGPGFGNIISSQKEIRFRPRPVRNLHLLKAVDHTAEALYERLAYILT